MKGTNFNEDSVLHELKHHLPSQTPLKDFIHHNSLHAFQQMSFFDAIFKASKIFGYQATLPLSDFRSLYLEGRIKNSVVDKIIIDKKGIDLFKIWKSNLLSKLYDEHNEARIGLLRAEWKNSYKADLDNMVHPLLFRVLCSYLDQGISIWKFPIVDGGFLVSLRELELNSSISLFKTERARSMLLKNDTEIKNLLKIVVGEEAYFQQYLFDQQFSHRGWSGIVSSIESAPHHLLDDKKISLKELIQFELLLEIDALDSLLGKNWKPLSSAIQCKPVDLFTDCKETELQEVLRLWQLSFEWTYYDEVLSAIQYQKLKVQNSHGQKQMQALFCIDERECSLRRYIEQVDLTCETYGTPGFFGVEFFYQPENGHFYEKLCPAPITPKYLIKEINSQSRRHREILYSNNTHTLLQGTLHTFLLGYWAIVKLIQTIVKPKMSPAISDAFSHMNHKSKLTIENNDLSNIENGLQVGFTIEEMSIRVESLLRGIGLTKEFAPIIYIIAHGSSSANNPHHGAHDCGACSGRPGSVNSRVFAFMANHPKVRTALREKGIFIPDHTQFIGALHDTAADQMAYYDEEILHAKNSTLHKNNIASFEKALNLNAKERSRRFASIDTKSPLKKLRKEIIKRSVSMFEPRPELGHGTNTLCVIGRRGVTKDIFFDRRAFMNSYNFQSDLDGQLLTGIMRPIGPVCGGINLEYYFSRVDNYKLGAGTKLPHNIMGLIGVANSSDGDLRPGLPLQMIEVHDPVRLLIIVEHYPEVILKSIQSSPEMYEWYINNWVHLISIHPETSAFYHFNKGEFILYKPVNNNIKTTNNIITALETIKPMRSNHIVDATKENLPVFVTN